MVYSDILNYACSVVLLGILWERHNLITATRLLKVICSLKLPVNENREVFQNDTSEL